MIDTLSISKRLKSAGVTEQQADIHAEILADVVENNLATKQDIALIHKDMELIRKEMEELRLATKHDIALIRKDMEQLRTEFHRDLAEMKSSLLKWMFGIILTQTAILVTIIALIT